MDEDGGQQKAEKVDQDVMDWVTVTVKNETEVKTREGGAGEQERSQDGPDLRQGGGEHKKEVNSMHDEMMCRIDT